MLLHSTASNIHMLDLFQPGLGKEKIGILLWKDFWVITLRVRGTGRGGGMRLAVTHALCPCLLRSVPSVVCPQRTSLGGTSPC